MFQTTVVSLTYFIPIYLSSSGQLLYPSFCLQDTCSCLSFSTFLFSLTLSLFHHFPSVLLSFQSFCSKPDLLQTHEPCSPACLAPRSAFCDNSTGPSLFSNHNSNQQHLSASSYSSLLVKTD